MTKRPKWGVGVSKTNGGGECYRGRREPRTENLPAGSGQRLIATIGLEDMVVVDAGIENVVMMLADAPVKRIVPRPAAIIRLAAAWPTKKPP